MNVTCDKCSKVYVVPDEKVAGKPAFKIRCKNCDNLVTVTVGASPPPPPPAPTGWLAMVGGQQYGPFELAALTARIRTGDITPRTHLWRAGMAEWKRAQELPELSALFAAPPPGLDIATAPEAPSPEIVKPTAQSGAGAVVAAPLDGLFGDDSVAPEDPFAALGPAAEAPPKPETTNFFIAQAGVKKRNPPWKLALFALAFVGGPLLLVWVLSSLNIVQLPTVGAEKTPTAPQETFTGEGDSEGLKALLTGEEEKQAVAEEEEKKKRRHGVKKGEPTPKQQDPELAAFYAENEIKAGGPKVRKDEVQNTATAVNSAGLSSEVVAKVVADKSKAFQLCIDNALHRNPKLQVGNITVVLTVLASGAVKSAGIEPKKHETSDWGSCMTAASRRIVFPASDGETQVELPFKVGVALSP